ncbi:MAG: NHL domain-containing protein [Candidatus Sulfotelmatobacter sp.]
MRRFTILAALFLTALVSLPGVAQDIITTSIGGGPNNMPAIDANLNAPYGVAVDSSGNFYIASYNQHRVFKVSGGGTLTVVAGSGAQGYAGDGIAGGAANANLYHPIAVAVDGSGNIYIADQYNCVVRKVDTTNTITTIAGIAGSCTFGGDGGKGTLANLYYPSGVAVDSFGNLFIGDNNNCRVRKVILSTDIISTYAGSGTCGYSGDGGGATSAELYTPEGVAVDTAGDLFIADTSNYVIRKVTKSTGKISTVAGNHTAGFSGDGGLATSAQMNQVFQLAVDGGGTTVTFADYYNQRVRQFTVGGNISTVAGTGTAGFSGDGAAATSAQLNYPEGVAVSSTGVVYVGDSNNYRVRQFTVGGNISTVAGNGSPTVETLLNNAAPLGVVLQYPYGIAIDSSKDIFIAESHNFMVRELVHSSNQVDFFAGDGTYGYSGDGGPATSAELTYDYGVAKDSAGNVYIADTYNHIIRVVNSAGVISTFAGVPNRAGFNGDGGPATSALLYYPNGVAVDTKGSVYIADYDNEVIRKVTAGTISTIAGIGGRAGYAGDGGPATSALLNLPTAVAVDPQGNVYIADYNNCRVRQISAVTGIINTVAGNGACGFSGDGVAVENSIGYPQGVAVDANGNFFIGDYYQRVRWVNPGGIMTTIAGNGNGGYTGDGGLATSSELYEPTGVALDSSGNILVSDYNNLRVRSISAFPALNSSDSSLAFGLTSVGSTSTPQTITLSALGALSIFNIATSANFSETDDCPSSMTNGSTCTMYVYFVPTAAGTLNGSITINSNGFFNSVNTISLTGLGSAISLTGVPVNFGNQLAKTTSAVKTVTVKNSGTTAVTMGAITLNETTDFAISSNTCPASGSKLNGGSSCSLGLTFTPTTTGAKRGAVLINDGDPTSPQLAGVSGTGISNVSLSPSSVTFAPTAVGVNSAVTKITLTNNTGASITLGSPAVTVTGHFLNAATTTCTNSLVIAATGTCVINVTFKPTAVGFASGTLSVADTDVTSPQTVSLQGIGTGIKFTPPNVNFGTVTKGTQVSSTVTITNVGTTPVGFTGAEIAGPNSGDFSDNYNTAPPCNNSTTSPLQPGATCTLTVYFLPTKTGTSESATYKVFDNSPGSPQGLALTGKGQ